MPAPTDLNSQIALAKGWTWTGLIESDRKWEWKTDNSGCLYQVPRPLCEWLNPKGEPEDCYDYVGTLKGVAGLMRELDEHDDLWEVGFIAINDGLQCRLDSKDGPERYYWAPWSRLGECVGEAWLSVFGKEAGDATRGGR